MANWLLQLTAVTALLAFGIHFVERNFSPALRLGISVFFGLIWIAAGTKTAFLREKTVDGAHQQVLRTARTIGLLFLCFGVIWVSISVYQYLHGN